MDDFSSLSRTVGFMADIDAMTAVKRVEYTDGFLQCHGDCQTAIINEHSVAT